jgi:hypothetical protein
MLDPVKNFAKATLVSGYAAGVTSIVVSSGEGAEFPDPATDGAFNLSWWNATEYGDPADDPLREIVRCTARSGDTLTIVRAQEGTSDNDHNLSDLPLGPRTYKVALPFTKKEHDEIAIQYKAISVSVNTLAGTAGIILVTTGATDKTITLPAASGIAGRVYVIKKIDSGSGYVIVDGSGSETIDDGLTATIKKRYEAIKIATDGSNWFVV